MEKKPAFLPKKNQTQVNLIPLSIFLDIVFIILADLASFIIRFNGQFPEKNFDAYLQLVFFIIVVRIASFYIFHLYEKPKYKSNFEILINTIKATTASSIIIIFTLYFFVIDAYPRWIAFLSWLFTIIAVSSWRFVVKQFVGLYLGKDFFRVQVLIIGTGEQAFETATYALRDATIEYKLVGFVHSRPSEPILVNKDEVLGTLGDLSSITEKYIINEVIIADPDLKVDEIAKLIRWLSQKKIVFRSAPSAYDAIISNIAISASENIFLGPTTLHTKPATWYWGLKRILDIAASFLILLITLPVFLLAAVLIKSTSPGPVFYLQKRVGQNGKKFIMYKLRTMYMASEKFGHAKWAKYEDIRITPVGKILRRYRIDELPQLLNILRNDMSLIGPRPERPYFTNKLIGKIPFYAQRLRVKPGITGWAQINFKYAATEEENKHKLLLDLFYIQNRSFSLDLLIALKTFRILLLGQGAH